MKSSIRRRVLMAGVVVSGMPAWTALADDGPARSWIGVELGEVPEMLALHLKLGGGGLLITNVAAAGPSEKAQLSRYDVIVKLNDDPVVNNIPAFIARVARLHPGEEIGLGIISRGDRRQVKLRLGVRPDDEIKWLYEPSRPSWEEVIKVIKQAPVDLVVMGTSGRTGLSHWIFGNTAEKVFRHAPCPVLSVRGPETCQLPDFD